jgi:hypothetical protein
MSDLAKQSFSSRQNSRYYRQIKKNSVDEQILNRKIFQDPSLKDSLHMGLCHDFRLNYAELTERLQVLEVTMLNLVLIHQLQIKFK